MLRRLAKKKRNIGMQKLWEVGDLLRPCTHYQQQSEERWFRRVKVKTSLETPTGQNFFSIKIFQENSGWKKLAFFILFTFKHQNLRHFDDVGLKVNENFHRKLCIAVLRSWNAKHRKREKLQKLSCTIFDWPNHPNITKSKFSHPFVHIHRRKGFRCQISVMIKYLTLEWSVWQWWLLKKFILNARTNFPFKILDSFFQVVRKLKFSGEN